MKSLGGETGRLGEAPDMRGWENGRGGKGALSLGGREKQTEQQCKQQRRQQDQEITKRASRHQIGKDGTRLSFMLHQRLLRKNKRIANFMVQ